MAHQGFDAVTIDLQHGPVDFQAAVGMLAAISTTPAVPMVRVPWNEPILTAKLLDAGAYGVICPMINSKAEAEALVSACTHVRDKLLLCLLRDTGMRIGQVLGLRHADMVSWDNLIRIVPRDNANSARTKSLAERAVDVFPSLMALYTRYLVDEYGDLDSDYVFINLWEGRIGAPMTYATVVALFLRLQRRTGIYARPHMFRHTHATDLIRTGRWDLAYVAERLGHTKLASTSVYLHLCHVSSYSALAHE